MNLQTEAEKLRRGEITTFVAKGGSMKGMIRHGETVTIAPIKDPVSELRAGMVVLCRVGRHHYLHKILQIVTEDGEARYLIGNNKGRKNGWTTDVFGRLQR